MFGSLFYELHPSGGVLFHKLALYVHATQVKSCVWYVLLICSREVFEGLPIVRLASDSGEIQATGVQYSRS